MTAMTALENPAGQNASYADLVERMFREFEDRLALSLILQVVNDCRHDLQGTHVGALPELTERLARHRLTVLATHAEQQDPRYPAEADTPADYEELR
jgi:hypothetical protein